MYSMIPFGRYGNSLDSLFDDFERSFFSNGRSQLPAFRTDIPVSYTHLDVYKRQAPNITRTAS